MLGTKPPASQPQPIISTENALTAEEVSIVLNSETNTLKSTSIAQALKTTTATTIPTAIQVHEIEASPAGVGKTGSNIGYSETLPVEPLPNEKSSTTPIMTSHSVVTSSPIVEMSSKPTEEAQPLETRKDESTSSTSSSTEDVPRLSQDLEIEASPTLSKQETTSTASSSPTIQTLSSQIREEVTPSKVLVIEPSPVLKEQETSSQVEEPVISKETESSQAQKEMTSSQTVTSSSIGTSSHVEEGEIPLTTMQAASSIKVKPSSLVVNEASSLHPSKAFDSTSVRTSLSPFIEEHSSQHIEEVATPQPTKTMTSSQLLTSSEALKFSQAKTSTGSEYSSQHLKDMTSLQPKKTMMSSLMGSTSQAMAAMSSSQVTKEINLSLSRTSSVENTMTSSLIANVMTSAKSIKDLTSSKTLKPAPSKEVKIVKSTLILSSSQLADLITSSHPKTMEALTSSTAAPTDEGKPSTTEMAPTPLVEEKATTTQSPKKKTTTSPEINTPAEKPVAMTTSPPKPPMTTLTTEHPPIQSSKPTHHSEPIHPSEPTHHGDKNATNTTHGGHEVHPTMGYPHEPPVVNAYTKEIDDDGWQISVLVVCSMLIGIVVFVVVFVIKSNREMR